MAKTKGYNASLKSRENVELYFVNKDIFELGKIEIESPQGKIVPIYDIERTLCDMFKKSAVACENTTFLLEKIKL